MPGRGWHLHSQGERWQGWDKARFSMGAPSDEVCTSTES
jgi:hypothetical protein